MGNIKVLQIKWIVFHFSFISQIERVQAKESDIFCFGDTYQLVMHSSYINLIKKFILNNLRHQSMYSFYGGLAAEKQA